VFSLKSWGRTIQPYSLYIAGWHHAGHLLLVRIPQTAATKKPTELPAGL
jgi:hypothetical protein